MNNYQDSQATPAYINATHWLNLEMGYIVTVGGATAEEQHRVNPRMRQLTDKEMEALHKWAKWQLDVLLLAKISDFMDLLERVSLSRPQLMELKKEELKQLHEAMTKKLASHRRVLEQAPGYIEDKEFNREDNLDAYVKRIEQELERRETEGEYEEE
jgi:hypothetical protein